MVKKSKELKEFFAVTMTSLYHIQDDVGGYPEVKKIALKEDSRIGLGVTLKNGTMVSVGNQIIVFIPEGHGWMSPMTSFVTELPNVNTQWWGGRTSLVVALFLKKTDAKQCYDSTNFRPCDPRWRESTLETLRAIGKDHSHFSITRYPSLRLIDPDEIWPEDAKPAR